MWGLRKKDISKNNPKASTLVGVGRAALSKMEWGRGRGREKSRVGSRGRIDK